MAETIVGVVYKWKHQFFTDFWKKYFLALDQRTGQLRYVKGNGEVKGKADLRKVFLAIHCRQLQPGDTRLKTTRRRFAPYALIIPMFEKNSGQVENQEFALGSLDELETWMRTFAECVGVLERFQGAEQMQQIRQTPAPSWTVLPKEARFNYASRWGYEPDFYPLLWTSFVTSVGHYHCHDYTHCHGPDYNLPSDVGVSAWSEPTFCFPGTSVVDPSTGSIMDPGCFSTSSGDDSGAFWSSFLGDSGGGSSGFGDSGGGFDSGGGCDSSGGGGGCDSGGGGGCDSGGGGGCDSGGGGGGCDSGGGGGGGCD